MKKIKITNTHFSTLTVYVRDKKGNDTPVQISAGKSIIAENDYMTNSMSVYKRKNLIKIEDYVEPKEITATVTQELVDNLKELHGITEEKFKEDLKDMVKPDELIEVKILPSQEAAKQVESYASGEPKKGVWDIDEEKFLKKNYPKKGAKFVAEELNRSYKSVQKKVAAMKLKKKKKK